MVCHKMIKKYSKNRQKESPDDIHDSFILIVKGIIIGGIHMLTTMLLGIILSGFIGTLIYAEVTA